jgi:peptidoglycan hydrolase CwlO-like protein
MSHYELEQVNRRIYDLMQKIEYLFEHPAIVEIQRKIDDMEHRIESIEEEIENIKHDIANLQEHP